ncbi:MAG: hypothetical protein ACYC5N_04020 [Endomicrobiales bacterium]
MNGRTARSFSCLLFFLVFACSVSGAATTNTVYGVYTETYPGMKYGTLNPPNGDGAFMGAWGATLIETDVAVSTEGSNCAKVTVAAGANGGMWMQFGYDGYTNPKVPQNMSAYSGGRIEFMVKTAVEMTVKIEWGASGASEKRINADLGIPLDNQWHRAQVPLSAFTGIDLTAITIPAGFHALWMASPPGYARTYYIDNVNWVKPALDMTPLLLTPRTIGTNFPSASIVWSGVQLGVTGWKNTNQYVECTLKYSTATWGIQIYTDNKAATANPRYTGTGSAGGLVDGADTTKALPMCWRIVDVTTTTYTIANTADYAHLYSPDIGDGFYPWMYIKDKSDPDFVNSADYITAWDLRGIHYGEGEWGGAISSNLIYLGADFTNALPLRTYKTSRLIIELFYE